MHDVTKRRNLLSRFLHDERGAQLAELALVLPVGIVLIFGSFEIGRAIVYHHNVDTSLRAAARYMARLPESVIVAELANQSRTPNLIRYGIWSTAAPANTPSVTDPGTILTTEFVCPACFTTDRVIRLDMQVRYNFELLNILAINPTLTFEVSHEQPYIGG